MKTELESASKENLYRDRRVLGKKWPKAYRGYFGSKKNIDYFVKTVVPFIPKSEKIRILYAASANGLLGEALSRSLQKHNAQTELCLVDISKEHLKENRNRKTKKIRADLLKMDLEKEFDIIIMRSSLDYFPKEELQVKALKNLRKHLAANGIFFNQAASMQTETERDLADRIYGSNNKIGKRHFQCPQDINEIYGKAGFSKPVKIGDAKKLIVTEKEHIERYGIKKTDVERIREIIGKIPLRERPNIKLTRKGYSIKCSFPIYSAARK